MGVSKNNGTPKWMVYKGKPYEQMDDLVVPLFLETPICWLEIHSFASENLAKLDQDIRSFGVSVFQPSLKLHPPGKKSFCNAAKHYLEYVWTWYKCRFWTWEIRRFGWFAMNLVNDDVVHEKLLFSSHHGPYRCKFCFEYWVSSPVWSKMKVSTIKRLLNMKY